MTSFRQTTQEEVQNNLKQCWQKIVHLNVQVPLTKLRIFNRDGYLEKIVFGSSANAAENTGIQEEDSRIHVCNTEAEEDDLIPLDAIQDSVEDASQQAEEDTIVNQQADEDTIIEDKVCKLTEQEAEINIIATDTINKTKAVAPGRQIPCTDRPSSQLSDVQPATTSFLKCSTQTGKALERVLGCSSEVLRIDQYRLKSKTAVGELGRFYIDKCEECSLTIRPKVLAAYHRCSEKIKVFENTYFATHGFYPREDGSDELDALLRQRSHAKKLLDSWKWYNY